jgi:pyruvate/2-oxoglutarate/acetoin dehydrogenase E1 component
MLGAALEEPDPVVIFEHCNLYNMEGELAAGEGRVNIDRAKIVRSGNDVTLITYGASIFKAIEAANDVAAEGIECEVVDLRTLRPLDTETFVSSVRRTHRAIIVDEGWRSGSISAEVSARIMESAFYDLDAPVERICSAEVPMPYAHHLEQAALPQVETIARTIRMIMTGKAA